MSILTVTLHPAWDETVFLSPASRVGDPLTGAWISSAGGKGVNVARALQALSCRAEAMVLCGGRNGPRFLAAARDEGLCVWPVPSGVPVRVHTTVVEREKERRILGVSRPVARATGGHVLWAARERISRVRALLLSGSLPPGLPVDIYAAMITMARTRGVPAFLDASGEALRRGIRARPFGVKINRAEAEGLLGVCISGPSAWPGALRALLRSGVQIAAVTLGAEGMIAAGPFGAVHVRGLPLEGFSVGCGDAALAGLVDGLLRGVGEREAFIWSAACGQANLRARCPGRIALKDVRRARRSIEVKGIPV
ncbi:MAG: hypothetical protein GX606_03270 [Elusimicrobia bacterium]|nr:hypothetical protein [Elusimicrobiota bacterium]